MQLLVFLFLLTSNLLAPHLLETDPIGWDGLRYALVRDTKYHGVQFNVSLDLTFVKQAAAYVRTVYEAEGSEGEVRLTVYERNPNTYRPEEVYSGLLDLLKYKRTAAGVAAPVKQGGFAEKITNLDTVPVDLLSLRSQNGSTLPTQPLQTIPFFSQPIVKRTEFGPTVFQQGFPGASITDDEGRYSTILFGLGSASINELGLFTYSSGFLFDGTSEPPYTWGPPPELLTTTESGLFEVELFLDTRLTVERVQGDFDRVRVRYLFGFNDEPPTVLLTDDLDNINFTYDRELAMPVPLSLNRTLQEGDRIYLYGQLQITGTSGPIIGTYSFTPTLKVNPGSFLRVKAKTQTTPTTADSLLVHEALARVVHSITDAPLSFYSEFFGRTDSVPAYELDGPGSLLCVVDSWRLRGFPLSERPFIVKLQELYDSLDAVYCLGLGLEVRDGRQVVRIEPRSYFYQTGKPVLTLQAIVDFALEASSERLYNTAKFGYQVWKSGTENGLAEFNSQRTYTLPVTGVKNSYDALSPYAASGYLLEQTRRDRYEATPTKENNSDGILFLVALERTATGYAPERSAAFTAVEGVLDPENTYNLRLSPKRMLIAHAAWLRSSVRYQNGRELVLSQFEGNTQLVSQQANEATPVAEAGNLPVLSMPEAIHYPESYAGSARLRPAQLQQLRRSPYGLISFLDPQGFRRTGHLTNPEVEPNTRRLTLNLTRVS